MDADNKSGLAKKYVFSTTPERSLRMSKIKSKNTGPEIALRKALWSLGIRYRINVKKLPGKPDIVIVSKRVAIFVDGEFWHGYNWQSKKDRIKANREYWIPKIEKNMERDLKNNSDLENCGYTVLRFWENQIAKDVVACTNQILKVLSET